jgi:fumarate reductase subunit C
MSHGFAAGFARSRGKHIEGGFEQMQSKPLQTDAASRISGEETLPERKLSLKQRVLDEVIKFLSIVFYLWVMFGVFALHESVVSAKDHIDYHFYGFAIVNALILGKVMLVAEDLHFAEWIKERPLIYPIWLMHEPPADPDLVYKTGTQVYGCSLVSNEQGVCRVWI